MKTQISKQPAKQSPAIPQGDCTQEPLVARIAGQNKPLLPDDVHARVAARAYELYVERGCCEGCAEQDWLEAEREIVGLKASA